jgi:hypothetical protein
MPFEEQEPSCQRARDIRRLGLIRHVGIGDTRQESQLLSPRLKHSLCPIRPGSGDMVDQSADDLSSDSIR